MNVGIICPSDIAYRRFLPALSQTEKGIFTYVGVNSPEERYGTVLPSKMIIQQMLDEEYKKAEKMISEYGGRILNSYHDMITNPDIDALYLPLPPALHYYWAKKALENGKHVLVEKPFTISFNDTSDLIYTAKTKNLAVHENYMFIFHNQLDAIEKYIDKDEIGEVRLYRIQFGFPRRAVSDFRYNRKLGGGALIDAGGYTIKLATRLLGESVKIQCAQLNYLDEFDVDIFGSATLVNDDGITAQIAFGMDNDYKCELEVWGSKGTLRTGRILTAPAGFIPSIIIKKNTEEIICELPADDAFKKSIEYFFSCIESCEEREKNYKAINKQAALMQNFMELADN